MHKKKGLNRPKKIIKIPNIVYGWVLSDLTNFDGVNSPFIGRFDITYGNNWEDGAYASIKGVPGNNKFNVFFDIYKIKSNVVLKL
mgnify:CR=1 FL=1